MLVCMSTIGRPRRLTKVLDSTKLSKNICKVMLVYNNL